MPSFHEAVALGVDALEFDVRLTSDGEVVVFHDPTLTRTTGNTGLVAATPWSKLRTLDAGAGFTRDGGRTFPWRDRDVRVSRLAEVLEALPTVPLLIEIKSLDAARPTLDVIAQQRAADRVVLGSFREDVHAVLRNATIPRSASVGEIRKIYLPSIMGHRYATLPFAIMSLPRFFHGIPVPLASLTRAAARAGAPMHVWVVNDVPSARRLWAQGIHGVLSDDPAPILKARDAMTQGAATARIEIG